MKEQLIQYVELLFAGAENCEDIKQEILQNTLDRYDDLIAEGKVPEAAYRLAIAGIGDINEILGTKQYTAPMYQRPAAQAESRDSMGKKLLRAIAVALYILSPVPLFILDMMHMDVIGLCGTLSIIAVATVLIILGGKKERPKAEPFDPQRATPQSELSKSVSGLLWAVGIALYFLISFTTYAWHITWVIFLIIPAVQSLVKLLLDLRGTDGAPYSSRGRQLKKSIDGIIWALGLALYFIVSFATGAWYITWVLFLVTAAVQGLARAIVDLKEAMEYEN